ncbi:MAG: CBS domain-containing protein [Reichenbachiella sp.]|uniref:CBS domain-containing protein n=1 Tax=Reichenbachiella sp. TaxID=2184521 RepID=UPI003267C133
MRAKDLINYTIPPLKPSDSIEKAQDWMSEFHVHELPIVTDGDFLGFFNENLLFDHFTGAEKIEDYQYIGTSLYVDQNEHYYELLKKAYEASSNLVAVLDENEKYLGAVTIQDVVEAFSKMSSIHSPGTIIVLSMMQADYSMTELSRIIESEGGKILSSFVEDNEQQPGKIRVTIKLNLENGSVVISSLERFGYTISSIFGKGDEELIEKERLDTLMRYLKV